MALTKLSFNQINSNAAQFSSGIINVNTAAKELSDNIGFIFNRDGSVTPNVAIVFNNTTDSFVFSETINSIHAVELGRKVNISAKSITLENTDNKKRHCIVNPNQWYKKYLGVGRQTINQRWAITVF